MDRPARVDKLTNDWAAIALQEDWPSSWVEGAIYPCEMVFFLASCQAAGVQTIVESGRQDGYSTGILGEYALRTGTTVVSIDLEEDRARADRCRARLMAYPLDLRQGNAFAEVPRAVAQATGPLALLIDGPKGFPALALAFALGADPKVTLISLHNLERGSAQRALFDTVASGPKFYEQAVDEAGEAWSKLRRREREFCRTAGAMRSLDVSSLGVLPIEGSLRRHLRSLMNGRFRFNQPPLLRYGWQLGLFAQTRYLFSLSFRIFGG